MNELDAGLPLYMAGAAVLAGLLVCMALMMLCARWREPAEH